MTLRVVVAHPPEHHDAEPFKKALARFGDQVQLSFGTDAGDADVFMGFSLTEDQIASAKNLKWVSVWAAGVEHMTALAKKHGFFLTNASGVHGPNLAEHALAMMLMFTRKIPTAFRNQLAHKWDRGSLGRAHGLGELTGETLLIVGLGRIGEELAKRAKAFDMKIVGIKRTPGQRHADSPVDEVLGLDSLDAALPRADHVVIYLPQTPDTTKLFDARRLALLKPSAHLYNLGRGAIIDEAALIEVLRAKKIAGAGLDVFEHEPLPAESPLWDLDNVILTPHTAGITPHYYERTAALFADNIERFLAGRPLENLFDPKRGY